jgi:hypothetical protein
VLGNVARVVMGSFKTIRNPFEGAAQRAADRHYRKLERQEREAGPAELTRARSTQPHPVARLELHDHALPDLLVERACELGGRAEEFTTFAA